MAVTLLPAHLRGAINAPASKSEAHRLMICAGLSPSETTLSGFMGSDDMAATCHCLKALGAEMSLHAKPVFYLSSLLRQRHCFTLKLLPSPPYPCVIVHTERAHTHTHTHTYIHRGCLSPSWKM